MRGRIKGQFNIRRRGARAYDPRENIDSRFRAGEIGSEERNRLMGTVFQRSVSLGDAFTRRYGQDIGAGKSEKDYLADIAASTQIMAEKLPGVE